MTQNAQTGTLPRPDDEPDGQRQPEVRPGGEPRPTAPRGPKGRQWRGYWLVAAAIAAVLIAYGWPPYLTFDPTKARIVLDKDISWHYALLSFHIALATLAIVTAAVQPWAWLRRRYPKAHRWTGRVYVTAVLPAAATALVLMVLTPARIGVVGIVVSSLVWVAFTLLGYRAARKRQWANHRRLMLYSIAIPLGNIWGVAFILVAPPLHIPINVDLFLEGTRWIGWVGNLMIVQWWLNRTTSRPLALPDSVKQPVG